LQAKAYKRDTARICSRKVDSDSSSDERNTCEDDFEVHYARPTVSANAMTDQNFAQIEAARSRPV